MPSLPVLSAMSCSAQSGRPHDARAVVDEDQLVAQRVGARHGRAEPQCRVGVVVGAQDVGDRLRVVEEGLDVGPGEPRGDQAEGCQGGVAPADVGVGVDDAVAGLARLPVERAAGVGHDDDAGRRVDAGLGERGLERAPLRVGLDGGPGLAGHHDHGAVEVDQGGAHHVGVGGVEHDQRHAGRGADDLRSQGGPAHAAQDHPVDALGAEVLPQRRDLAHERPRRPGESDPGQADRRLRLGLGTPQRGVLGEQAAGEALLHQLGHAARDGVGGGTGGDDPQRAHALTLSSSARTPFSSSSHEASNLSTPSFSRRAVTSA